MACKCSQGKPGSYTAIAFGTGLSVQLQKVLDLLASDQAHQIVMDAPDAASVLAGLTKLVKENTTK